jgi:hypothetical protein
MDQNVVYKLMDQNVVCKLMDKREYNILKLLKFDFPILKKGFM